MATEAFEDAVARLIDVVGWAHVAVQAALVTVVAAIVAALMLRRGAGTAGYAPWLIPGALSLVAIAMAVSGWLVARGGERVGSFSPILFRESGDMDRWSHGAVRAIDEVNRPERWLFAGLRKRVELTRPSSTLVVRYRWTAANVVRIGVILALGVVAGAATCRVRHRARRSRGFRAFAVVAAVLFTGAVLFQSHRLSQLATAADLDAALNEDLNEYSNEAR